jgi:hypothetical protein
MNYLHAVAAAFLAFVASCSGPVSPPPAHVPHSGAKHVVVLAAGDETRLGLTTQPAKPQQFVPRVHGYGVIISLSTIGQTDSDITTAQAAFADSQANADRMQKLYDTNIGGHAISLQALETAKHQAASDRAALDLANRKEIATFGERAPWRSAARDSPIIADITSGNYVLVQATFALDVNFNGLPPSFTISRLNAQPGDPNWTATKIWDGPEDPTIPGRSFFALAGGTPLAQGEHVLVYAPTGPAITGVAISSDAVVLNEDKSWCYIRIAPGTYKRVPIDLSNQLPDGYFVAKGIAPSQPVVVKGAGLLLSHELGAATPGQD